jgi:aspartyl protease
MIVRYTPCPVNSGVPALAGAFIVPRPFLAVQITGPSGFRLIDGLLDTGADETILNPSIAPLVGIDLSLAIQRNVHLVGRGSIRCRYAPVKLRITDGILETYEWDTIVGFAPFPLLRNLLGFGGFLQFFDANFRGEVEEVVLFPNTAFKGRVI